MTTQALLIQGVKELIQDTTFDSTRILNYLNQGIRQIAGGIFITYPDRTQVLSSPAPLLGTSSELETSIANQYISLPTNFGRGLYHLVSDTNDVEINIYDSFAELLSQYPTLDNTSRVIAASIRGSRLYYQGMPSVAETLTAYYYRVPTDMKVYSAATISFAETGSRIADSASALTGFVAGQTIDITGTANNNTSFIISAIASDYSYITTTVAPTTEAATGTFYIRSRPDGIPEHLHESLLENYSAWQIYGRKTKEQEGLAVELSKRHHGLFLGAMLNFEAAVENVGEPVRFLNARW